MRINRVLLILCLSDALILQLVRALARWSRGDVVEYQTVLAEHVLISHCWVEGRAVLDNSGTAVLFIHNHASTAVDIDELWLIVVNE